MKVVHLVRQFSPAVGGLEDAVINLVRQQRERLELDSSVVTLDRIFTRPEIRLPSTEIVDGIPVRRIPWKGSTRYPFAPSVLAAVRDADMIHVHAIDFFFDWMAMTRAWHGKPMVATTHGGFFHSRFATGLKKVWFNTVTRASCRAYGAIVAASHSDAKTFANVAAGNLVTVENGVNVAKFSNASSVLPTRHVIYFGRFARHKRIDLLMSLLAALHLHDPSWRLTVAGAPSDHSGADIERMAFAAGVRDAVSIIESPSPTAIRQLVGEASFFASASEHEGFGLAAVEALSAGLIPVLSDIPSFSGFVEKAGCGILLHSSDTASAAVGMQDIADSGLCEFRAMRLQCIAASERYGWDGAAERYSDVYRSVLESGGRRLRSRFGSPTSAAYFPGEDTTVTRAVDPSAGLRSRELV